MTNLCVCDFWLSPQSAKPLVRTLKSVNYVLMNDLTQWLCEFCSRRRLLNTFTVKVTKHTVNSFKSIRSRWCLVTEDGVSLDISPQGTVTPYHLSHILNWLVNRLCVCACGCTTAGDFDRIFVCRWMKMVRSSHGSVVAPLTSHWLLCFIRQTCCPALTTGLPLAVKLMLPVFKYLFLLILGGLRQAVSIPSHFVSREREKMLYLWKILLSFMSTQTLARFILLRCDLFSVFEAKGTLAWSVSTWIMISSSLFFKIWHALHFNISHSGEPSLIWSCQVEFAGGFHVPRGCTIILGF